MHASFSVLNSQKGKLGHRIIMKTPLCHAVSPQQAGDFSLTLPTSPQNHLPDIHVHRACLEWWLWLLFSVPPTGQIPVLPALAMRLDGILKQAVSWKLKPFWEAGLGGWDNWHSAEWEEKEKQHTSC